MEQLTRSVWFSGIGLVALRFSVLNTEVSRTIGSVKVGKGRELSGMMVQYSVVIYLRVRR